MDNIKIELKLKTLVLLFLLFLVVALVFKIKGVLMPFAISFFIAYLLDPPISYAEKFGIPRSVSIIAIFIFITAIICLIAIILIPILYREISSFVEDIPGYIDRFLPLLNKFISWANIDVSLEKIKDIVINKGTEISSFVYKAIATITSSIKSIIGSIILYALVPILIFYFSKDYKTISKNIINTIDENTHIGLKDYIHEFNIILSSYFRGQFLVALILGILYSVVLLIVGVKPALLVGLSAGFLSIVPYLGFVYGFTLSTILAYVQYLNIWHPIGVIIGFTIVQILESNFITPKIVGKKLGLHPTVVIFALLIGGSLLGIAGMIFSLPVAAALKVWLNKIISSFKKL